MTSCGTGDFNNESRVTRSLVQADVRNYSHESQNAVRSELQAQGCLPIDGTKFDFSKCTIPETFRYLIDYHKSRQHTRIANKKPEPGG